ncbi:glycosyltransferase [Mesorhizobium sp. M0222]|uniref:glycosyltransferase n=1 Tax=Mesorhizobium sp. M0222 TaxID=2956921 RepID=UPI003335C9AC
MSSRKEAGQKPHAPMNSETYWSRRFETDWVVNRGREQSVFFGRIILDHLPEWLTRSLRDERWTICDWGCALGDGTDLLAQVFPGPVTGIDFAEPAIASARATFSKPHFLRVDLFRELFNERFDVVVSSNTLEHFDDPVAVLERLGEMATEALVILVPFREYLRLDEHKSTFDPSNIPATLAGGELVLATSKVLDARAMEPTYWAGEQILLVYARTQRIAEREFRLSDLTFEHCPSAPIARRQIEIEDEARARSFIDERARWNVEVARLARELSDVRIEHAEAEVVHSATKRRIDELSEEFGAANTRTLETERIRTALADEVARLSDSLSAERHATNVERVKVAELLAAANLAALDHSRHIRELHEEFRVGRKPVKEISEFLANATQGEEWSNSAKDEEIATLRTLLQARDDGITWLQGEIQVLAGEYERRRTSFRILLADLIILIRRRWPWLRGIGKVLLPRRLRFRILSRANSSPLLTLVNRAGGQPRAVMASPRPAKAGTPGAAAPAADHAGLIDIVCFANIAWSARYQRPQQLMSNLAARGYRVLYIVPSRTPPPGRDYDLLEVANGVFEVSLRADSVQDFYSKSMSRENQTAFGEAMSALARDLRIKTAVTVVHLTYWTPLALALRTSRGWHVQYDCMDEWDNFPNIGRDLLHDEETLVREADLVTVTAALLQDKWQAKARRCALVRNGVDYTFFQERCVPNDLLASMKAPIIGYYGALAEWLDFELIAAVARQRPDWSFVLIGDDFSTDLAGLDSLPNVHLLGLRPYSEMPQYLYWFDACLIPFRVYNVTHAVDPVKFYEYMSAGKPVIATPTAELQVYKDYLSFAATPDETVQALEAALAHSDQALSRRRRELAKANDWSERVDATLTALRHDFQAVSIIVVTYNNIDLTKACIDSLIRNTTYPNYEIIVVDNASEDGTQSYLRQLSGLELPIRIELNRDNRGFAAANNQGLRIATGDLLVLLNNDTLVPKGWLDPLIRNLEDPSVGLVGPVTNEIGNEAKIPVEYSDTEGMEAFADKNAARHAGQSFDIPMLAMFCVAMRRDTVEAVGPLDEAFGLGLFEDDDYSRRIHEKGLRTICAEDAFVHHIGGASFTKLPQAEYAELWQRNQAHFESKWGGWTPHRHRDV